MPRSLYRALLAFYPAAFRHEYGGQMQLAFDEQLRQTNDPTTRTALWLHAVRDALTIAPQEHAHMIGQDIRYAFRTMAASPQFAAAAILSLALAIGANTALYGLWDGVINAWLPVRDPGQLVIFTNPASQGVSIGMRDGERILMTYAEFEQIRDHTTTLSMAMAVESDLSPRQTLIDSSMQEVKMRMVSREYFDTFGIRPAIGRFFKGDDADGAVLSDAFWRTRFAARPDVLGKTITIRNAVIPIIGVAPRGFFGETSGQEPALWIPLSMQPSVAPGRDWLHDTGFDKVMWLHVFGRLKPGVSLKQAEAEANSLLRAQLEIYYGSGFSAAERAKLLNQRLTARPASNGASSARSNLADPLRILFLSVGVVLLIACANLASLLIARGAGRKSEIALRLSLGASRVRLVRQLLTESLALAFSGGVAGLALAYVFHSALVRMVAESDRNFHLSFPFGGRLLLFNLAITSGAALLFGMLPAWSTTRSAAALRSHGQNSASPMASGSSGRRRWGSPLVVVQLALSLPLLAGAGLLSKTLLNLQQVDLGFAKENLLELRVDAATLPDGPQRAMLFDRLLEDMRRMPGVTAATYSAHGVFAGGDSGDDVEVEGYTRKGGDDDGASRWSQVGPDYFATMRTPILRGRPFTAADSARAPRVCVINEAFQERFYANRNPLGLHVTNVDGPERTTCEVIGIVRNSRTNLIRQPITPRYYVPVAQPLSKMDVSLYLLRSPRAPGPMFAAVERAIRNANPELSFYDARPVAERVDDRLAQDRITARLAATFGIVALLLAATGLYGVLAHGVARRRGEIAIRMAIGARPVQVVAMFLRETGTMIVLGLAAGALLAYWTLTLLANQLFGLAPHDPATLSLAALILVAVALAASLLPARRAARMDPMAALRQE